jgi:hypothetical protein
VQVLASTAAVAIVGQFNVNKCCHPDLRHNAAQFLTGDDISFLACRSYSFYCSGHDCNTPRFIPIGQFKPLNCAGSVHYVRKLVHIQ